MLRPLFYLFFLLIGSCSSTKRLMCLYGRKKKKLLFSAGKQNLTLPRHPPSLPPASPSLISLSIMLFAPPSLPPPLPLPRFLSFLLTLRQSHIKPYQALELNIKVLRPVIIVRQVLRRIVTCHFTPPPGNVSDVEGISTQRWAWKQTRNFKGKKKATHLITNVDNFTWTQQDRIRRHCYYFWIFSSWSALSSRFLKHYLQVSLIEVCVYVRNYQKTSSLT